MHPLTQQIERLRQQLTRQRWLAAVAKLVAVGVATAAVLMLLDTGLRSTDRGLRWLAAGAVVTALIVAARRWLLPLLQRPATARGVALQVEEKFPELGSRLASALAFAEQAEGDPLAGSDDLRRAVVVDTTAQLSQLPIDRVVDQRPAKRSLAAAAAAVAIMGLFAALAPSSFGVAAQRLVMPWANVDWPRQHQLVIAEAAQRLSRGQTFSATIVDRNGRLPDDLRIVYRTTTGGNEQLESQPIVLTGSAASDSLADATALVERANVRQSFEFKAVGGDDTAMAWQAVEVVDPPSATIASIIATPPSYSGLPTGLVGPDVRVLAGTRLAMQAEANAPTPTDILATAAVEITVGEQQQEIPVRIDQADDGSQWLSVAAEAWVARCLSESAEPVAAVGTFQLRLATSKGLVGRTPPRVLRIEPDLAPQVAWDLPSEDWYVTAGAVVPLAANVTDDLAIQRVELRVQREEAEADEIRLRLHTGPETPPRACRGLGLCWSNAPRGERLAARTFATRGR